MAIPSWAAAAACASVTPLALGQGPLVEYRVETYAVESWTTDWQSGGDTVHLYNGGTHPDGMFNTGPPTDTIGPGESLLLRVSIFMPGHGQTFPGSGTLPLRAFCTAWFDLRIDNGLSGTTDAGSAPIDVPAYQQGTAFAEWEDMYKNLSGGHFEVLYGPTYINRIIPFQYPGFTSPLNATSSPWVVDLLWTPADHTTREIVWSLRNARDVLVLAGTTGDGSDWQEFGAMLPDASGVIHVVPAPAGAAALLALLMARRRRGSPRAQRS